MARGRGTSWPAGTSRGRHLPHAPRVFTFRPANEPPCVRLYVYQVGKRWAAMLLADEKPPREPGAVKGLAFFGATPTQGEQAAKAYLGHAEPVN